jgi:hypothetical protein
MLNKTYAKFYNPSKNLAVYEVIVLFNGGGGSYFQVIHS